MIRYLLITCVTMLAGCATARLATRVETLEASVARIEANVQVGGDGDSVVSWIQAAGLVAAALAYPLAIRPVRKAIQARFKRRP